MFFKIKCSSKFHKFHRKTPVLESHFKKVAGLKACNFIKKRLQHRCFPVRFEKFLRTPFFTENLWWLLLITNWSLRISKDSTHRRCSVKKGDLRNFAKFAGKHLCQSLFFNKVAGLSLQLY